MDDTRHHAPILWLTGRAGETALAQGLERSLGRPVVVASGPDELHFALRVPERPLALVVGAHPEHPVAGGILRFLSRVSGQVPIVYVGGEDPAEELAARRAGVHYVAQRPLNQDELKAVLSALADHETTGRVVGLP